MIRKYIIICHSAGKKQHQRQLLCSGKLWICSLLKEGRVGACFSGFSPSRFLLKPQQEP